MHKFDFPTFPLATSTIVVLRAKMDSVGKSKSQRIFVELKGLVNVVMMNVCIQVVVVVKVV